MDFIFMLTRRDRTVDDAEELVAAVCDLGVRHVGFKDVGVPPATMERVVARIHAHHALCYLEVVSTTAGAVASSVATGAALGVDCILGGKDLDAARRALGGLDRYFPFPGRPIGHPTRLEGTAADVEAVTPSRLSLMPDAQMAGLTPQEAADLLEFLVQRK